LRLERKRTYATMYYEKSKKLKVQHFSELSLKNDTIMSAQELNNVEVPIYEVRIHLTNTMCSEINIYAGN